MGTLPGTSLLLTLLTTDSTTKAPIKLDDLPNYSVPEILAERKPAVQTNIETVVSNIKPRPATPHLIKDVAQKELYEILYSIIAKQYKEPETESQAEPQNAEAEAEAALNRTLTSAIGMALEIVIRDASEGRIPANDPGFGSIIKLRDELRKRVIKALIPK